MSSTVNLIRNKSMDVMSKPNLDASIQQVVYRKYRSDTNISPLSTEVTISVRDVSEYFSLTRSYLEIEGVFSQLDGTDFLSSIAAKPALEGSGVAACFSQARLRVQNVLVNDLQNLAHVNTHFKRIASHSKSFLETQGRASGTAVNDTLSTDENVANRYTTFNENFVERRRDAGAVVNGDYLSTAGVRKTFTLRLSDLFSLADCDKLMKNTTLKIELGLRSSLGRMFSATALDTFNLKNVSLQLAIIEPTLLAMSSLESEFSGKEPINYVYKNYTTYQSPVFQSPTTTQFTFNVQSQMPLGCYVALQQTAGSLECYHDSSIFDKCNVTELGVLLNNKIYPYDRVTVDWNNGNWLGVYEQLTRSNDDYLKSHDGIAVSPRQFFETTPVYWIDFSSAPIASSYQIAVETRHSSAPEVVNIPAASARSANVQILMCAVTLAEMSVAPLGNATVVRST